MKEHFKFSCLKYACFKEHFKCLYLKEYFKYIVLLNEHYLAVMNKMLSILLFLSKIHIVLLFSGRSRNLIISELRRTNLDVNLAVNNLLSRNEEDGDDGDEGMF